ncbi:uncharacterized protein LOC124499469 isoform X2 [Dermatophagoides farinae]|uniref:uncharacterized protein LOC124499469 isoform X2 n=1 Tax=Dermatophagoides farinae TaxID=6954 RepID=UPI003F5E677F
MDLKISITKNPSSSTTTSNTQQRSSSTFNKSESNGPIVIPDNQQQQRQRNSEIIALPLIEEFQHFKIEINEHLQRLETLLERFKTIIRINYTIDNQEQLSPKMNTITPTSQSMKSTPSSLDMGGDDDLRNVLTDIDQHLSILKEIEQRNSFVCESFSREIRSRDEALLDKMRQITLMNHELATMQAKIQHLAMKNSHLENEIKYLKTASSVTNTEASSTPVGVNDLERIHHQIVMDQHHQQQGQGHGFSSSLIGCQGQQPSQQPLQSSSTIESKLMNNNGQSIQMERKFSEGYLSEVSIIPAAVRHKQQQQQQLDDEKTVDIDDDDQMMMLKPLIPPPPPPPLTQSSSSISKDNNQQKDAIYHDLLVQYRKIEQLIQQSRTYKISNYDVDGNSISSNDINTYIIDQQQQQQQEQQQQLPALILNNDGTTNESSSIDNNNDGKLAENEQSLNSTTPATVVEVPLTLSNHHQQHLESQNEQQQQQQDENEQQEQNEQEENMKNQQKSIDSIHYNQQQQQQQSSTTMIMDNENEDVVTTSIKAYEHFVKMQHDLETLMKKENEYRNRIMELEQENQRLDQKVKDDEFTLSDVQYELEILKHNYELEIESFSTAINERESLIEKLQQKMQSLKARYFKLDERLKMAAKSEIEFQTRIEELEGRLKYEELQKQTMIDSRLNEMEQKLHDEQNEYQMDINNLKTDLSCSESVAKELRSKIDELEASLKNMASAEFEDEFVYYKNQIDSLVKELDKEKQERQRQQEQFEQTIRSKDKHLDQCKEQMKKEKDSMIREKTEYEQRFRKMMAKLKSKENEIKQLQEKVVVLNEKFKPRPQRQRQQPDKSDNNENIDDQTNDGQLLAELALNEIKLTEMTTRLDDQQEQLRQMEQQLENERQRRRQLETFYLNSLNNNNNGDVDNYYHQRTLFTSLDDDYGNDGSDKNLIHNLNIQKNGKLQSMDFWQQDDHHHHFHSNNTNVYNPYSQSSLALSMDDHQQSLSSSSQPSYPGQELSLYTKMKRWLRRQKNILLFGSTRSKFNRIIIVVYLLLIHYLVFIYYSDKSHNQISGGHGQSPVINADDDHHQQQFVVDQNSDPFIMVKEDDDT